METDQIDSRTVNQIRAGQSWRNAKGRGGIKATTGWGKTRTAIKYCIVPTLTRWETGKCIIIVHRIKLKKQWEGVIENFDMPQEMKDRIQIYVVNTIIEQQIIRQCTLLVLDEVSEYYGEEFSGVYDYTWIDYRFLLWLDATPIDSNGRHKPLFKIAPIVHTVTKEEAIANGWVTNCEIYNLEVELTEEEKELYNEYTNIVSDCIGKFGADFDLAGKCARGGNDTTGEFHKNIAWATKHAMDMGWSDQYPYIVKNSKPYDMKFEDYRDIIDINNLWNPEKVVGYAAQLFEYTHKRKYLLAKSTNKLAMALRLVRKFKDKKIVSFSQSTEFVSNLCRIVNEKTDVKAVEYHSKIESRPLRLNGEEKPDLFGKGDWVRIKTKSSPNFDKPKVFGEATIKKLAMEWFAETKTGLLSLGSALDKGLDVPDIDVGIVSSMNNKRNQHTQRQGRSTRTSKGKDVALMIYIYCKDTQDINYIRNIQYKETSDIFWIKDIDEIGLESSGDKTLDLL